MAKRTLVSKPKSAKPSSLEIVQPEELTEAEQAPIVESIDAEPAPTAEEIAEAAEVGNAASVGVISAPEPEPKAITTSDMFRVLTPGTHRSGVGLRMPTPTDDPDNTVVTIEMLETIAAVRIGHHDVARLLKLSKPELRAQSRIAVPHVVAEVLISKGYAVLC